MILKEMDFTNFYKHIEGVFLNHFSGEDVNELMGFVKILSDANFRCYRANSVVIDLRKTDPEGHKFLTDKRIADMEWVARSVGEYRVSSKARINKFISRVKSVTDIWGDTIDVREIGHEKYSETWASDDIVYSIGEMMDRLSIETIKRQDFITNNRPKHMVDASQDLSDRVEKYLIAKLKEINKKGFYECIHEQRTYDLEKIVKELAL